MSEINIQATEFKSGNTVIGDNGMIVVNRSGNGVEDLKGVLEVARQALEGQSGQVQARGKELVDSALEEASKEEPKVSVLKGILEAMEPLAKAVGAIVPVVAALKALFM